MKVTDVWYHIYKYPPNAKIEMSYTLVTGNEKGKSAKVPVSDMGISRAR
jgi:hypothetical protein